MTPVTLQSLRRSMEGTVPAILATADRAGFPNVSIISQVHYVDVDQVALSYQFFNKTRRNLLETGFAAVQIVDPLTCAQHRLALDYVETRSAGPVFESMKAKLAGIASHTGMEGVFRLLGADIFRVRTIEQVPGFSLAPPPPTRDLLAAVRRTCLAMATAGELSELLDVVLGCLGEQFGIAHCMILVFDPAENRLITLASSGYPASGVGSEVLPGEGVIGVAARECTPIRISHMTSDYRYGEAIRDSVLRSGIEWQRATEIPFPGLAAPDSQIALPILSAGRLFGVLFAESVEAMRFQHDDEDALAIVADQLGARVALLPQEGQDGDESAAEDCPSADGRRVTLKHFARDDSLFLDHDYLIKGVAGAILWRLVSEHAETGRTEFTTRELRLDPSLKLPEFAENLDARLVLLRKRLEERNALLRIEKCGRGRLRLRFAQGINLEIISA